MKRFEYRIEYNIDDLDLLNTLGKMGWQLVSIKENYFYFKRELK